MAYAGGQHIVKDKSLKWRSRMRLGHTGLDVPSFTVCTPCPTIVVFPAFQWAYRKMCLVKSQYHFVSMHPATKPRKYQPPHLCFHEIRRRTGIASHYSRANDQTILFQVPYVSMYIISCPNRPTQHPIRLLVGGRDWRRVQSSTRNCERAVCRNVGFRQEGTECGE